MNTWDMIENEGGMDAMRDAGRGRPTDPQIERDLAAARAPTHGSDPPDRTRRFLFAARVLGGHTHVNVRAGTSLVDRRPDGTKTGQTLGGTRALCGEVVFDNDEWSALRSVIEAGAWARRHGDDERIEVEITEEGS